MASNFHSDKTFKNGLWLPCNFHSLDEMVEKYGMQIGSVLQCFFLAQTH